MNKKFEEFINEIKGRLLAYEMDESCFADYDDNDRQMMRRLREALYPSKQQVYLFKDSKSFKECNKSIISMEGGRKMKRMLVKIIFWILEKVDKDMCYDIIDFLGDAEKYYIEKINVAERNNAYNHIKIDTKVYERAKLRIEYIRSI